MVQKQILLLQFSHHDLMCLLQQPDPVLAVEQGQGVLVSVECCTGELCLLADDSRAFCLCKEICHQFCDAGFLFDLVDLLTEDIPGKPYGKANLLADFPRGGFLFSLPVFHMPLRVSVLPVAVGHQQVFWLSVFNGKNDGTAGMLLGKIVSVHETVPHTALFCLFIIAWKGK